MITTIVVNIKSYKTYLFTNASYYLSFCVCRISTERFTSLAEQIAQTFQESSAVYYTPFVKRGAKSVNASGKLWERFSTEKTNLKDRGILKIDNTSPTSTKESTCEGIKNF